MQKKFSSKSIEIRSFGRLTRHLLAVLVFLVSCTTPRLCWGEWTGSQISKRARERERARCIQIPWRQTSRRQQTNLYPGSSGFFLHLDVRINIPRRQQTNVPRVAESPRSLVWNLMRLKLSPPHSVVRSLKNDSECVLWWKPCFVVFSRIGATNRRYKKIRNLTPCQNNVLNWKRSVPALLSLRRGTHRKTPVPLNHHDAERSK